MGLIISRIKECKNLLILMNNQKYKYAPHVLIIAVYNFGHQEKYNRQNLNFRIIDHSF
jgi:hypothetical protein